MFFQQAFKGVNDWWRYILVSFLVFIGYQIGTIPLMLALWRAVDADPNIGKDAIQSFMAEPNFSNFGINTNLGLTLMLLLFVAALVVFYFTFGPIHNRAFKSLSTTSSRLNWKKIFFAFFVWMGLSLITEGINYFMAPEDYSLNFKLNTFLPLLFLCIFILPLQTSFEELFFRGYLMQGIGTARIKKVIAVVIACLLAATISWFMKPSIISSISDFGPIANSIHAPGLAVLTCNLLILLLLIGLIYLALAISKNIQSSSKRNYKILPLIITSVLFGLMHSANPEIEKFGFGTMQVYYISAGLLLGIMTIMDDGLELALGTHAATNFTGAVFVGYDGAAIRTDSVFVSHALNAQMMTIMFIILSIIFLVILKYKYKWVSFGKILDPIEKPDDQINLEQYIDSNPLATK